MFFISLPAVDFLANFIRENDCYHLQISTQMCNCSIHASSASNSYHLNSANDFLTCDENMITIRVSNTTLTALPINNIYSANIQIANVAGIGYGSINISE